MTQPVENKNQSNSVRRRDRCSRRRKPSRFSLGASLAILVDKVAGFLVTEKGMTALDDLRRSIDELKAVAGRRDVDKEQRTRDVSLVLRAALTQKTHLFAAESYRDQLAKWVPIRTNYTPKRPSDWDDDLISCSLGFYGPDSAFAALQDLLNLSAPELAVHLEIPNNGQGGDAAAQKARRYRRGLQDLLFGFCEAPDFGKTSDPKPTELSQESRS